MQEKQRKIQREATLESPEAEPSGKAWECNPGVPPGTRLFLPLHSGHSLWSVSTCCWDSHSLPLAPCPTHHDSSLGPSPPLTNPG